MPPDTSRREFVAALAAWPFAASQVSAQGAPSVGKSAAVNAAINLRLGTFRFDVTPPIGHPLCGGWIQPAVAIDDALEAIGFVIVGTGKPIVVCAVDWTGLLNEAHVRMREVLAEAAGTTADRVALQCVHQHNAPFACLESERIITAQGDLPHSLQLEFWRECLTRGAKAVRAAMDNLRPVTHIAHGQAKVDKVASNRRVERNSNGDVQRMRGSSCGVAELRALPEGLIDPQLKTVAFYDQDRKLVACHYYATHPMSYYGDGRVNSDFVGLARKRRQQEDADCRHVYFTGCGGNVAAGKYNDGSPETRKVLAERVYAAIEESERPLTPTPIRSIQWQTAELLPSIRSDLTKESLEERIADAGKSHAERIIACMQLGWLRRLDDRVPLVLSSLAINDVSLLHLPAECFVEYQLRAQQLAPEQFVATAAYGDGGPWYIPTEEEYPHGGYEVGVAFCDPQVDDALTHGIQSLLQLV